MPSQHKSHEGVRVIVYLLKQKQKTGRSVYEISVQETHSKISFPKKKTMLRLAKKYHITGYTERGLRTKGRHSFTFEISDEVLTEDRAAFFAALSTHVSTGT